MPAGRNAEGYRHASEIVLLSLILGCLSALNLSSMAQVKPRKNAQPQQRKPRQNAR